MKINNLLSPPKVFFILYIIGQIIYLNSWGNAFIFDDNFQIVTNQVIHSVNSLPSLFLNHNQGQDISGYYRPLPYAFYTLIYFFFKDNTFPYHWIQLLFHVVNTFLIFLIFKKYIKQNLAFLMALLFLVHPINEETVAYISNLQDVLFVFFGLVSIYILQKDNLNLRHILVANLLLLFSLLSKETGALFFIICFLYMYLFKKIKLLLYTCMSFFIGLIYIVLRLSYHLPFQKEPTIPIVKFPFWERMLSVPMIIYYYIKNLIFPKDLVALHSWVIRNINFNTFFLPLIIDFFVMSVLAWMIISIYIKVKDKKIIIFFSAWLIGGLLFHLQIIPLDMTVADRFFYFPFIGLLALIGLFFQYGKLSKSARIISIITICLLLLIFSLRTILRNSNWKNQTNLLSHDEKVSKNDYLQELMYGDDLEKNGKYKEAFIHTQNALKLYPQSYIALNNLGVIYYAKGDIKNARKAWMQSILIWKYPDAYDNLAMLLLKKDTSFTARSFIRKATNLFPNDQNLWYDRIIAEYLTHDYRNALIASKQYYLLKRDSKSMGIYLRLQNNLPFQIKL